MMVKKNSNVVSGISLVLLGVLFSTRLVSLVFAEPAQDSEEPIAIGSRRELFVDDHLIDRLDSLRLVLHQPRDEGPVLSFDQPWEGPFSAYCTVIKDGPTYRLYFRGSPTAGSDGNTGEVTCYAESSDGIHWTKPQLGLFEVLGQKKNNVILADATPVTHNFSPFLDTRPNVPAQQRYKALGGTITSGLIAYTSPDGIHWEQLREQAVISKKKVPFKHMFDSQNVAFWSPAEECYACYFRVFAKGIRSICRTTSDDFLQWSEPVLMQYQHHGRPAPIEHLYTNQTHPYFRAPHLYLSIAARFMPGRRVLTDEQARAINVHPKYFADTSDAILMTTRGGAVFQRTFLSSFIRPGIGPQNWVSRTNYPALGVVQTGPTEMSVYVNHDYAQATAHLRRYSMRLDGFASVRAEYEGGELLTKPLTFMGRQLQLGFATSAAGGLRIEIQDAAGKPIPGFTLNDADELIGNEIERVATWNGSDDLSALSDQPIRLRLVLRDADLFSLRFGQ